MISDAACSVPDLISRNTARIVTLPSSLLDIKHTETLKIIAAENKVSLEKTAVSTGGCHRFGLVGKCV
jgi:hypothetical protein